MTKRVRLVSLIAAGLLLMAANNTLTQIREELREEFHQIYPLAANGWVSLANINGSARITAWDRNEVKVDAVKHASTQELLAEAEIIVDASQDDVRIKTKYPEGHCNNNPASVEYTLTVPRNARLDGIELINGSLDIDGVAGGVRASCINGHIAARGLTGEAKLSTINGPLTAHGLTGEAKLSSVNGRVEATFERLSELKPILLDSVNGSIDLIIPSDASARLNAATVHGEIENDFGLPVHRGEHVGRDLAGMLGRGGTRIKLNNVNGGIRIRHASDGRPLSPVTNLLQEREE